MESPVSMEADDSRSDQPLLPVERRKSEPKVKRRLTINTDIPLKDGEVVVKEPTPVDSPVASEEPKAKRYAANRGIPRACPTDQSPDSSLRQKTAADGTNLAAPSIPAIIAMYPAAFSQPNSQGVLSSPGVPLTPSAFHIPPLPSAGPRSAFPLPIPGTSTPAKQDFLAPFGALYDSMAVNRAQLDDQIRRSGAVLESLSAAGTMIESLVKSQWRTLMNDFGQKMGRVLTDLDARLRVLEGRKEAGTTLTPVQSPTPASEQKEDAGRISVSNLVDKVVSLDDRLKNQEAAHRQ